MAIPNGQITIGIRVYDVAVAAIAQNGKEAIALRSPGAALNTRHPSSAAPMSAAMAMKPRIRGTIIGIGQGGVDLLRRGRCRLTVLEVDRSVADALRLRLNGTGVRVVDGDGAAMPFLVILIYGTI